MTSDARNLIERLQEVLEVTMDENWQISNMMDEAGDLDEEHDNLHEYMLGLSKTFQTLHWFTLHIASSLNRVHDKTEAERILAHFTYQLVHGSRLRKPHIPNYDDDGKLPPEFRPTAI